MVLLFTVYFLLFTILAWKNFRLAIGIFILSLPTYLIRVNIGPLPSTLLELSFGAVFLVWLIKYAREDWPKIVELAKSNRWFCILLGLFLLASVTAIFRAGFVSINHTLAMTRALGHWRAYFLEPMLLFMVLIGRSQAVATPPSIPLERGGGDAASPSFQEGVQGELPGRRLSAGDLIIFLVLSAISISIVALVQKFTGHWYPPQLWNDVLNGRVTSFFTSPNAVGLYLAPIIFLVSIAIVKKLQVTSYKLHDKRLYGYIVIWLGALAAILFSYSQGAWIAVGAGVIAGVFLIGYKKTALIIVLFSMSAAFYFPSLRGAILFQDKASQNRLLLWNQSAEYLNKNLGNFVFGTGLRKFYNEIQKPLFQQKKMEQLLYPHNIFLNFWTETGLLGVISFTGLFICLFMYSWRIRKYDKILGIGLICSLVAFTMQGLVDVPYFKNDLAFLFWILVAIVFFSFNIKNQSSKICDL